MSVQILDQRFEAHRRLSTNRATSTDLDIHRVQVQWFQRGLVRFDHEDLNPRPALSESNAFFVIKERQCCLWAKLVLFL